MRMLQAIVNGTTIDAALHLQSKLIEYAKKDAALRRAWLEAYPVMDSSRMQASTRG